ncbi:VOC family protein [Nonomuraea sp. NPDC049758]|uniref:VOC family protein n=1 Tax=Nonomuraea sp. NPDC049758 TaxID=3154360 RepID=UPI00343BD04B
MSINVVIQLNFRGEAAAALAFYRSVFGGDVTTVTYADAGNVQDPADAGRVMWGQVAASGGFRLMAYDVPAHLPWDQGENAFFVSLGAGTAEEATAYWEGLGAGATVVRPLGPAQWVPLHGMVRDRFGVSWIVEHGAS